jgi:hypothetical protein
MADNWLARGIEEDCVSGRSFDVTRLRDQLSVLLPDVLGSLGLYKIAAEDGGSQWFAQPACSFIEGVNQDSKELYPIELCIVHVNRDISKSSQMW